MNVEQEKRRDNLMRLARMANIVPVDHFYVSDVFLERFAEMVAAAEREACAKVCDANVYVQGGIAQQCAAEIRARGET